MPMPLFLTPPSEPGTSCLRSQPMASLPLDTASLRPLLVTGFSLTRMMSPTSRAFFSLNSAGSIPMAWAISSISDSMAKWIGVLVKPLMAPEGGVFV